MYFCRRDNHIRVDGTLLNAFLECSGLDGASKSAAGFHHKVSTAEIQPLVLPEHHHGRTLEAH
jgi:hypothetical protein